MKHSLREETLYSRFNSAEELQAYLDNLEIEDEIISLDNLGEESYSITIIRKVKGPTIEDEQELYAYHTKLQHAANEDYRLMGELQNLDDIEFWAEYCDMCRV